MLLAWQPFTSGARLPSFFLLLLAGWLLFKKRIDWNDQSVQRLGIIFLLLLLKILLPVLLMLTHINKLSGKILILRMNS